MFRKTLKESFSVFRAIPFSTWFILFTNFIVSAAKFMVFPFLAVYLKNNTNLSLVEIGFLLGLSPLASMSFSFIGGRLSDIFGMNYTYPISLFTTGLFLTGYTIFDNFYLLSVIAIFCGFGWTVYNTSTQALLSMTVPQEKLSKVFSYNYWFFNLGGVFGPLIGVYFVRSGTNPSPFYLFSILLVLMSLISRIIMIKYFDFIRNSTPDKGSSKTRILSFDLLRKITKDRILPLITFGYFFVFFVESQLESSIIQYLDNYFNNGAVIFGKMLSLSMVIIIVLQPVVGHFLDKLGNIVSFVIGGILYGIGPIIFIFGSLEPFWYIGMALLTIGELILGPKVQVMVAKISTNKDRATYFSILGMGGNFAYFIGPWAGAIIWSKLNISYLFLFMFASSIISAASFIFSNIIINSQEKVIGVETIPPNQVKNVTEKIN